MAYPLPQILTASSPDEQWLYDATVCAVNRLAPRSAHHVWENADTSLRHSLDDHNGAWMASVTTHNHALLERISESSQASNAREVLRSLGFGMSTARVPGHLQTDGLFDHQYVNTQYPWDGHEQLDPPAVPKRNHVGIYTRDFALSAREKKALHRSGERVSLTFDGAAIAIYVWLNGAFIGYAEDSFTPSEFDITEHLREDSNTLVVACYEFSTAHWLEDQDYWRLHGLFRSVHMDVIPAAHIAHMRSIADFEIRGDNGLLGGFIQLTNANEQPLTAVVDVVDSSERVVFTQTEQFTATQAKMALSGKIAQIQPWSAEDPQLYTLRVRLVDAQGATLETAEQKIGFRHFELDSTDHVMKLNGQRIVFKGVNRHEFGSNCGRAISEAQMLWDIRFLKQHNINAVRTSHYPNQSRWYELCDEYGIYLIDETNLETHGSWTDALGQVTAERAVPGSKEIWLNACMDRVHSMVERDFNHASVLIWSLGNESYGGEVFARMTDYLHDVDTRPVHYEGTTWDRAFDYVTDMESRMYAHPDDIEKYLNGTSELGEARKPYISCEYMHAMGNSLGGMKLYTDLEKYDLYQGGFIWDYGDQALEQQLPDGSTRLTYGGDWFDRPSDYEFSGDGIIFADRKISAKAWEAKALYANVKITVTQQGAHIVNDNLFTSTSAYTFVAKALVDGVEAWSRGYTFDVPALSQADVDIAWPSAELFTGHEVVYELTQNLAENTAWAPAGFELSFGQRAQALDGVAAPQLNAEKTEIVQDMWNCGLHTPEAEVLLSRQHAGPVSFKRTSQRDDMIIRTPQLTTWRALTDNDRGYKAGFKHAQWLAAGRFAQIVGEDFTVDDEAKTLTGRYTFKLATPAATPVEVLWEVDAHARIHLHATFPGSTEESSNPPAFGLEWMLPAEYSFTRFYGLGPVESYADRKNGVKLGLWSTTIFEDLQPYLVPQENGNHEETRFVEITNQFGHGLRISAHDGDAHNAFAFSALPVSSAMLDEATHIEELPAHTHTFLRLLAAQQGVGGDDSWGSPVHKEFQIDVTQPLTLDVDIELI
ncbi:glycoside hydrolase family 2 TIM barrel-domain containing protein [Alloscardovia criceti]|uniref:glycoside hydrolase family 2 TIM barrel-domain containing protein n=1 Tax=Alloscardovia criceti TaxID=356828 RepID=UPI0003799B1D|nr:glycoside hydrolase family 2 TIM barrel-domain containing protein [Alloscardovia criceti]